MLPNGRLASEMVIPVVDTKGIKRVAMPIAPLGQPKKQKEAAPHLPKDSKKRNAKKKEGKLKAQQRKLGLLPVWLLFFIHADYFIFLVVCSWFFPA